VGILEAEQVLSRLSDEYDQAYYAGIICERRGKARLHQAHPGSGHDAYESLCEAMSWCEQAATLQPSGNGDSLLG